MDNRLVIGIDPGKTTGVALLNKETSELIELHSMTFWSTMNYCILSAAATVVVEVPETRAIWSGRNAAGKAKLKVAANVGGTIREAELLVEGLELAGKIVRQVPPRGKIDHATFCKRTGWDEKKRTNNHNRDAGMLAYLWRER